MKALSTGLLFLLASSLVAQSGNFIIERFSLEQGLSQSVVDAIYQDSKGFLWFGTQDGLNRYDGYTFTVLKNEPGNPNALPGNSVATLLEDKKGRLWIGTLDGLSVLDGKIFTNYVSDPDESGSLMHNAITALGMDSSGRMWIGTDVGLQTFDEASGKFTTVTHPSIRDGGIRASVTRIFADSKDRIWVGTVSGLYRFDGNQAKIYPFIPGKAGGISDSAVFSIIQDHEGTIWLGTRRGGMCKYNESTDDFTVIRNNPSDPSSLPSNNIISICEDPHGRLWLGSFGDGLMMYDRKKFYHFEFDPNDPTTISDNEIARIFCDRSGTIWAGTSGGGVNKVKENHFTVYRSGAKRGDGLHSNDIWGIREDQAGNLWIGLYDQGVDVLKDDRITNYKHDPANPRSLIFNTVYSIFLDRDNQLWIGTDRGISRRSPGASSGVFQNIVRDPANPAGLTSNSIMQIFQDSKGNLWIPTLGGGVNFLEADQVRSTSPKFIHYKVDTSSANSIADNQVYAVAEDSRGHLWFGTQNGLNEWDGERFRVYRKNDERSGLTHNTVMALHMSAGDRLWIGTQGGGLNLLRDGKFTAWTQKDGLPNNVIYAILEDEDGNIWMSTNQGLSRFNPKKNGREAFRNYDTDDGLPSNEFNQGSAYRSPSGIMYFGGIAGMIAFNPKDLTESSYSPPVYLTAFRKFDEEVEFEQDFSRMKKVEISYKENYFGFDFVALDYRAPLKNQYAYKLEGFDADWIYTSSRRYASYTNIDGGSYVFKVRATNSDGVWSNNVAEMRLVVHPPFWKTLWFQFSTGLFALVVAYSFYQSRMRQIKMRNILLEKRVHERTKEIEEKNKKLDDQNKELEAKNAQIRRQQAQIIQSEKLSSLGRLVSGVAHEINNPLNYTYGSSANLEIDCSEMIADIERQLKEKSISEAFAGDLTGRIREMLEMVQAIKRGSTRIKDVVVGLRDFSTSDDAAPTEIELNVNLDYVLSLLRSRDRRHVTILKEFGDVPKIKGFPGHFNQAVMNVLINAIEAIDRKHYEHNEGVIKLKTSVEENFAVITIIDNGDGIPEAIRDKVYEPFFTTKEVGKGTGLGLATAYGVVLNHRGKITFDSVVGQGTEFRLYFPIAD